MASFAALNAAIDATPLIDNHCHNLLKPDHRDDAPLVSIASEAQGEALKDADTSLAYIRATKHLAQVLGCEQTWPAVESAIKAQRAKSSDAWTRRCLQGVETLLLDDGFGAVGKIQDYSWHDQFVRSKCKRIVRIETFASDLIESRLADRGPPSAQQTFEGFLQAFATGIRQAIKHPDIVGFKSIICYRGGLDIPRSEDVDREAAAEAYKSCCRLIQEGRDPFKRKVFLPIIHILLHHTASALRAKGTSHLKPIQFHTGLGDNDITLTKSSPSHLQAFIREYPEVPIVLLHSSWPWTREAAYLATMYPNVYADIGEVIPFLSRDGQVGVFRQMLELCPWSKMLLSTDGHGHPEMYLVANTQIRSALKTILGGYVRDDQIDEKQAIQLVQSIMFKNSNKLYQLGLDENLPLSATSAFSSVSFNGPDSSLAIIERLRALNCTAAGVYDASPDWSTLTPGPTPGHASVFCEFKESDGSDSALCPRTVLRKTVDRAAADGLTFIMGFELEFVVMERNPDRTSPQKFIPLPNDGHAWGMARVLADVGREGSFSNAIDDILDTLTEAGILIEQFHPESAPGQYEIVLPPLPPMEACDNLLAMRQIVEAVTARHEYRMTLHPKPFAMAPGSASHVHMSISSAGGDDPAVYEAFYAGILKHYPALIAFTYSNPTSYERMVDSCWAGGRWVTWGTQNKESPLRKCDDSHWELKTLDGLANPYLAIAAVLAAGARGVADREPMVCRDSQGDPARMSEAVRKALGITTMFPKDLKAAIAALEKDEELAAWLGKECVQRYIDIKNGEMGILDPMTAEERRQWVLERY
ncbi:hypothetical protein JX266_011527 [Neoarthrinium moseri]|nr:hypothetical protein JX266_011527 [Neoarthrinium moseri]